MTYGVKTWRLIKNLEKQLRPAEHGVQKVMVTGATLGDREQASWIGEQTWGNDIKAEVKRKIEVVTAGKETETRKTTAQALSFPSLFRFPLQLLWYDLRACLTEHAA